MSKMSIFLRLLVTCGLAAIAVAQTPTCPARPSPGTVVQNPLELDSQNGLLQADFTFRSSTDTAGYLHECYIYQSGSAAVEAPTLVLNPGDQLILNLTNRLTYLPPPPPGSKGPASMAGMKGMSGMDTRTTANDPCTGGTMVATSTNIHFHGLNLPPKCHLDDVLHTDIENTDPAFEYKITVPKDDQPGMYWYHPHVHGQATLQVNGGAAGALIVAGMENVKPQVAGLPERVFIVRQQFLDPNSWIAGPNQLTLNYQPATSPNTPAPILQMQPAAKEFWRIANSTSQAFLNLQVWFGVTPQPLEIIALDGIPVTTDTTVTTITIPPAGRVEFIVQGPAANQTASLQQIGFDSGPIGNPNPSQELIDIQASAAAKEPPAMPKPAAHPSTVTPRFSGLSTATVTATRKVYFGEATNGTNGPTEYFMTVDGQTPKVFSMTDPPAITTTVGAVEDWTIENRTGEVHAFHIHQVHFLYLATNGQQHTNPELRDTVVVPAWLGSGPYPTVTLRMDFRDPQIAGQFVYHCHILDHEDGGMMAIIQVNPQ